MNLAAMVLKSPAPEKSNQCMKHDKYDLVVKKRLGKIIQEYQESVVQQSLGKPKPCTKEDLEKYDLSKEALENLSTDCFRSILESIPGQALDEMEEINEYEYED